MPGERRRRIELAVAAMQRVGYVRVSRSFPHLINLDEGTRVAHRDQALAPRASGPELLAQERDDAADGRTARVAVVEQIEAVQRARLVDHGEG